VTRIPIACTLDSQDATDRVEEWRTLVGDDVADAIRTADGVRFRLCDNDHAVLRAIDLCRREKSCCGFFDFRLVLLTDAVWLEIEAPNDAAPILDGLFALQQP